MSLLNYFNFYFLINLKYETANLLIKIQMLTLKNKGAYPTPM